MGLHQLLQGFQRCVARLPLHRLAPLFFPSSSFPPSHLPIYRSRPCVHTAIWYPTTGFGAPPEDQAAANKKAVENLDLFTSKFLCGPGKFIGGSATPTIADYVCATRFHMCGHAACKKTTGFELPAKIKIYVLDFLSACQSKDFLQAHDGFLSTKL